MKKSRFTETQIVAILRKPMQGGAEGSVAQARNQFGDVLQLEGEVRRTRCFAAEAAEGDRGRASASTSGCTRSWRTRTTR